MRRRMKSQNAAMAAASTAPRTAGLRTRSDYTTVGADRQAYSRGRQTGLR